MATRNRKAAPASAPATTAAEADAIYTRLQEAPRLLASDEEVRKVERNTKCNEVGRRALLATMKFSGAELIERTRDDEHAYGLALTEAIGTKWIDYTRNMLAVLEGQRMRLLVALCARPDMEELQARAAAELAAPSDKAGAAHHG